MSAFSLSAWGLTETYSPAAIDMAPATSPAKWLNFDPLSTGNASNKNFITTSLCGSYSDNQTCR